MGSILLSLLYATSWLDGFIVASMHVCQCDPITKRGIGLISLMLVRGMDVHPAATAHARESSRALACGGVVMVPRLRVGEGAS